MEHVSDDTSTAFVFGCNSVVLKVDAMEQLTQLELLRPDADTSRQEQKLQDVHFLTDAVANEKMEFTDAFNQWNRIHRVHANTVDNFGMYLHKHIDAEIAQLIREIRKAGKRAFIVDDGFSNYMGTPLLQHVDVDDNKVIANRILFGADKRASGITQTGKGAPLTKLHVVQGIRAQFAKIFLIGDGMDDLRLLEYKAADDFLGVGIHAVRPRVQKEAPSFATTTEQVRAWVRRRLQVDPPLVSEPLKNGKSGVPSPSQEALSLI